MNTSPQPENWRLIPGRGYEVSDLGRVRNAVTGRVLRPRISRGYPAVSLLDHKGPRDCRVHVAVALAFLGQRPASKPDVNHINGVKADNRLVNLEWCSKSENTTHAYRMGLCRQDGSRNGNARLTEQDIADIRAQRAAGVKLKTLAAQYSIGRTYVCEIARGKHWKHIA